MPAVDSEAINTPATPPIASAKDFKLQWSCYLAAMVLMAGLWIAGDRRALSDRVPLLESWATLGAACLIAIGILRCLEWRRYDRAVGSALDAGHTLRPKIARMAFIDLAITFPAAPLYASWVPVRIVGSGIDEGGLILICLAAPCIGFVAAWLIFLEYQRWAKIESMRQGRLRSRSRIRGRAQHAVGNGAPEPSAEFVTSKLQEEVACHPVNSPPVLAGLPFGMLLYAACFSANVCSLVSYADRFLFNYSP
jgi:hypothetical protein